MTKKNIGSLALAAGLAILGAGNTFAEEKPGVDPAEVAKAFEVLKTYDWGADRNSLNPIDQAIIASHGDDAARKALEESLLGVLTSDASRSAKDFVCRKLRTVGTAQSVPTLAALLPDAGISHMARYALERIPGDEAAAAMRNALPQPGGKLLGLFGKRQITESTLDGKLKVGVIGSLGVRRDAKSVPCLSILLADEDPQVAAAAAHSLGLIGTPDAGKALRAFAANAPETVKLSVADACLACAEKLLEDGNKSGATALYKTLNGDDQPKHIQVAATKGLLAVAAK